MCICSFFFFFFSLWFPWLFLDSIVFSPCDDPDSGRRADGSKSTRGELCLTTPVHTNTPHTLGWIWTSNQCGSSWDCSPWKPMFSMYTFWAIWCAFCVLVVLNLDFRFSVREKGMEMESVDEQAEVAVTLLRQFLAINTSHPDPDYQVPDPIRQDCEEPGRGRPGGWSSKLRGWVFSVGWKRWWRESPLSSSPGEASCNILSFYNYDSAHNAMCYLLY